MSDDELTRRAGHTYAETKRLIDEGVVRVEQTLTLLHRSAVRQEDTFKLLQTSIERLAKAGRQSVIRQALAEAQKAPFSVSSGKGARRSSDVSSETPGSAC